MDPEKMLVTATAIVITKETVGKILGPTADLFGEQLKSVVERYRQNRDENVARIFKNAEKKLGDRINLPGSVHPKVFKEILDDGAFTDDQLAAEYFGGVLASSRTGVDRDDRGASFAKLVADLSVYQLRAHYVIYGTLHHVYQGQDLTVTVAQQCQDMMTFMPWESFLGAMEFTDDEDASTILPHCIFGLYERGLIGTNVAYGALAGIQSLWPSATEPGLIATPTALGTELFLWAHGFGALSPGAFLSNSFSFNPVEGPTLIHSAFSTKERDDVARASENAQSI